MPNPIISIANQKGGVGKTTTTISLAACLALQGRRALIVDIDPQANATSGLGLEKTPGDSVLGPLMGEAPVGDKIKYTVFENIYVLPSEIDMCGAEIELCGRENPSAQLTRVLEPLRESPDIDLILIDCPPLVGHSHAECVRGLRLAHCAPAMRILRIGGNLDAGPDPG